MFRPRIIPVLLLKNSGLVKSRKFKDYTYIGDPINAVKIFNELKADELVFLDITASRENRLISLDFVQDVGEEANMPFAVGGGIRSIEDIRKIISCGAEKVVVSSYAAENPNFIKQAVDHFGSSTIVVCIDVKKKFFGGKQVCILNGSKYTSYNPVEYAKIMEDMGAGEIIIQSVDNDGEMNGYDIELLKSISAEVSIPIVALGGAGNLNHLKTAFKQANITGLAAGSMFVFHGIHRGVLINYPSKEEKLEILN
ncbi:MAG TPA: AglZ/HisF2 family acetamidino modification protein [Bacteroidales bacterium]|nr:AglZ/HisF2 family acetamidino modification protein [Bacteroidales bacterium]HOL99067.1 AglZ/HisF2 family acetamidino modification protein [Bacteroidales bacterium]HUM33539.1 AglZ/HisF2 family acetamidino modification protein [Bacteroidales bacterium]